MMGNGINPNGDRGIMENLTHEHERDEQRTAEAQAGAESVNIDRATRIRAPRSRADMRERYEQFG